MRSDGVLEEPATVSTGEGHDDAMHKNITLSKPKWSTLLRTVRFRPGPNNSNRTGATTAPANTIQQHVSAERSNLSAFVKQQGEIRGEISDT